MNQGPGSSPYKLIDLVPIVREALQGNTSFSDNTACQWLQRSILNITENLEFEELKTTGPLVTLPANIPLKIPVSQYISTNDDVTLIFDPVIYLDPQRNTISYPMDYMDLKAITPLLHVPGSIPFKYTRHGNNFLFGGIPAQSYTTYLDYQVRHPFATDGNLQTSPCMFPVTWGEIMAYDAARRGAISLRWWDIQNQLKILLWGDPKSENNPGLIKELTTQQQRDQRNSSRQFMVRVSKY